MKFLATSLSNDCTFAMFNMRYTEHSSVKSYAMLFCSIMISLKVEFEMQMQISPLYNAHFHKRIIYFRSLFY